MSQLSEEMCKQQSYFSIGRSNQHTNIHTRFRLVWRLALIIEHIVQINRLMSEGIAIGSVKLERRCRRSALVQCDISALYAAQRHTMSTGACRQHAPIYQYLQSHPIVCWRRSISPNVDAWLAGTPGLAPQIKRKLNKLCNSNLLDMIYGIIIVGGLF